MEQVKFNIALIGDIEFPSDDITHLTTQHCDFIEVKQPTKIDFEYSGVICDDTLQEQLIEQLPENTPILTVSEWRDIEHLDRFFIQLYTGYRFELLAANLTHHQIIQFHSHHKYLLMAYSPKGYQFTGKLVASIKKNSELGNFYLQYRTSILTILAKTPPRKLQVNAIQHMQGYFKNKATKDEKMRFGWLINDYQQGNLSVNFPLSMVKQLLSQYPDHYLSEQYYLSPYPECEKIRALP
ncbi:YbgA family protein [Providencia burhodogranariea]|uniref:DUF1722 domain-containing protein n=1 Tax=Providencia burhodogranariea DSM 19968 TaxID=1141662 RepID=K8WNC0_9GAMM|nr:YbgA family protein [Providencia burhodogranariea]EKT61456.1 hypothetical protein OOA_10631 [Providencia burhodogranariea DSM 19968]